jgi:hypothetical protein
MVAEKTPPFAHNTSEVSATILLTITGATAVENSSIEDSESDSLNSEKPGSSMASNFLKLEALQPTAGLGFKDSPSRPCCVAGNRLGAIASKSTRGLDPIGTSGYVRPASEWKGIRTLEAAVADPVVGQETGI